jgi:hypothetical protein
MQKLITFKIPCKSVHSLVPSAIKTQEYKLYFVLAGLNKIRVLENLIFSLIRLALNLPFVKLTQVC